MSIPSKRPANIWWRASEAAGAESSAISESERRRSRAIYEDEDDDESMEQPEPSQVPVRPSDQYDIFTFLQFCSSPESGESLLPEMRDFARRLNIPRWSKLNKQQLCQQIRQRMSLTDLPQEMLLEIGEWLPVDDRSILKGASKTVYQSLPATNLAQLFVDKYGVRAFEVLFGLNITTIDSVQYEAAETFVERNPEFFTEHDLHSALPIFLTRDGTPYEYGDDVEFVPGIIRRLIPVSQTNLFTEFQRQFNESNRIPLSIPLVRIQTIQNYGRDTTACATISLNSDFNHNARIYTPPPPTATSVKQKYVQTSTQTFEDSEGNFAQSARFFSNADGWYIVARREREPFPWLSFFDECGIERRSRIAQIYMNAIIWSIQFQQEHPELHPILANFAPPSIGNRFWETKAREEQAIADLFGYQVQTSSGHSVTLPLELWVTEITQAEEYKQIARQLLGPSRETEYDARVLRMMTPSILHTNIFLRVQAEVQKWWQTHVYPGVPHTTPLMPQVGGRMVQPTPPIIPGM